MLRIRLLGRVEAEIDGVAIKLPVLPKSIPLWGYLLLHRAAPLSRDRLASTLWPEKSDAEARAALSRHLHQLRLALPPDPAGGEAWLLSSATTVQWNPAADFWLDVDQFVQLSTSPRAGGDEARLAEAVALYRGDLLAGVYDDWLFYDRERLRDLYIAALERLTNAARQRRDYPQAIAYAHQLLACNPLHEHGVRLLLAARYESGDRAGALADYERFGQLLRRELDVDPMPETVAVYEAVLHQLPLPFPFTLITDAGTEEGDITPKLASTRITLPLVGRTAEWDKLTAAWGRAARGQGQVILIGGEAGIGKTRLVAELAQRAVAQGGRVLHGAAIFAEPVPYQVIVSALRAALPLIAALLLPSATLSALLPLIPELAQRRPDLHPLPRLEPARERDRLYQALTACWLQLAAPRPLLLALEDLHWAGAATIDYIETLAHSLRGQPLLILATYREDEALNRHPLRKLRRALHQSGQHLALTRLDRAAVAALVGQTAGLAEVAGTADRLYAESEGNPFFLTELIFDLERGEPADHARALPQGVRSLLAERIARLTANTRLVAEIAAVAGAAFNLELIGEVAGWGEGQLLAALDELLQHRLVREDEQQADYTFAHHLIQETIYAAIDPGVRKRRHRRTALVIEELYAEQVDELAATLARHFDNADEPARAVPYYLRAAARAFGVYAYDEALAAATRTLELAADPRARFDSHALRERIYQRLGQRDAQRAELAQMSALADELEDMDLRCQYLSRQVELHHVLGEREQQAEALSTLIAAADSDKWRAVALQEQANYQMALSEYPAAAQSLNAALSLHQQLGDSEAEVECYCLLAQCAADEGRFDDTQRLLDRASALSAPGNRLLLARMLKVAISAAKLRHQFDMVYQLSNQLLELYRTIGDREGEADAHNQIAGANIWLLRFAEAFDHFEQARGLYHTLGKRAGEAAVMGNTAVLLARIGRHAEAIDLYQQSEAAFRALHNPRDQVIDLINIATAANNLGRFALAKDTCLRGLNFAGKLNIPIFEAELLSGLGAAEIGLGEAEAAITHLEAAVAMQRQLDDASVTAIDLADLTIAYLMVGRLPSAQQSSAEALALVQSPDDMDYPEFVYWAAACVAHAARDMVGADTHLQQAYEVLQQVLAAHEQELLAFPDNQWRTAYLNIPFNRELLAAYERGEWPRYVANAEDIIE